MIPLPFSNSLKSISISLNSYLLSFIMSFIMPFTSISDGKGTIPLPASFPPHPSENLLYPYGIPFLSFFLTPVRSRGISAAFPKSLIPRFLPASNSVLRPPLHSCSNDWWIIRNPSAKWLTLSLHPCLLLIPPALSFMSQKIILKPSIPFIRLKVYYKDNPDIDPYEMAYGLIPSQAAFYPDEAVHQRPFLLCQ